MNQELMNRPINRIHSCGVCLRCQANRDRATRPQRHERGSAVLVVLILLSLMIGLVFANTQALNHLHKEMRLIEKRQLKKFESKPAGDPHPSSVSQPVGATANSKAPIMGLNQRDASGAGIQ